MDIIAKSDIRYKYLTGIYDRYNYDNIMKYFPGYDSLYYYIPPELVLHEYESCRGDTIVTTLDNCIESWYNWVSCKSLTKITIKCCNLTSQEFFDIMVLHINDTNNRPKCPNCNKFLKWSGKFLNGYAGIHWSDVTNSFCSRSCELIYMHSHPDEYPHVKIMQSNIANSVSKSKADMNRFLSEYCGDGTASFYITYTSDGYFKFGITTDIDHRSITGSYTNPHILKTLNYKDAAYLEASIKLNFGGREYLNLNEIQEFNKVYRDIINKAIINPFN